MTGQLALKADSQLLVIGALEPATPTIAHTCEGLDLKLICKDGAEVHANAAMLRRASSVLADVLSLKTAVPDSLSAPYDDGNAWRHVLAALDPLQPVPCLHLKDLLPAVKLARKYDMAPVADRLGAAYVACNGVNQPPEFGDMQKPTGPLWEYLEAFTSPAAYCTPVIQHLAQQVKQGYTKFLATRYSNREYVWQHWASLRCKAVDSAILLDIADHLVVKGYT